MCSYSSWISCFSTPLLCLAPHPAQYPHRGTSRDRFPLLKQLHLLMVSDQRSPPGTALGRFICEGDYFALMHNSIRVPQSRMEPCQLLLPGPDAIFIVVNCRKEKGKQKKKEVLSFLWQQSHCSSVLHLLVGLPVVFHRIA